MALNGRAADDGFADDERGKAIDENAEAHRHVRIALLLHDDGSAERRQPIGEAKPDRGIEPGIDADGRRQARIRTDAAQSQSDLAFVESNQAKHDQTDERREQGDL